MSAGEHIKQEGCKVCLRLSLPGRDGWSGVGDEGKRTAAPSRHPNHVRVDRVVLDQRHHAEVVVKRVQPVEVAVVRHQPARHSWVRAVDLEKKV